METGSGVLAELMSLKLDEWRNLWRRLVSSMERISWYALPKISLGDKVGVRRERDRRPGEAGKQRKEKHCSDEESQIYFHLDHDRQERVTS